MEIVSRDAQLLMLPVAGLPVKGGQEFPTRGSSPSDLHASPPAHNNLRHATELGGDPELAATSVSIFTLASAIPYTKFFRPFNASEE